jgi:type I restriction enzyme R subunit
MIAKNPIRMDLYKRYLEIISEYNLEKDRVMIEKTFAELMAFMETLDTEDKRAMKEGLDEDTLALFDLLEKPNLKSSEREKIKRVAKELLSKLKSEYLKIQGLWDKDATKAEMRTFIKDFLYADSTGLPASEYTVEDVNQKAEMVYTYLYQQYLNEWRNTTMVAVNY